MAEDVIGTVEHFYGKISVSMIKLSAPLKVGDKIRIKGKSAELVHDVTAMQINRVPAQEGNPGDVVSIQVAQKVHPGDTVEKIAA
ncbi:MAG: translation elongation factor-like protein [Elusimicrobia bacterium]|nr:translation elongation factor-like protein [Elusimicrobiota bacterium]